LPECGFLGNVAGMIAIRPDPFRLAAWILMAAALFATLALHLLPALLAGLLVVQLVHLLAPHIVTGRVNHTWAKILVVALILLAVLGILGGLVAAAVIYLRTEGGLSGLLSKMAEIVENSRALLPPWASQWLPQGSTQIRLGIVEWLRAHAEDIRQFGGHAGRTLLQVIIGLIIGSFIALRQARAHHALRPLAQALCERSQRLGDAFRRVVFAQVRISALNAALTAVYLLGVLPLFGVHLPFTKTMILVTFIVGLMPILGNLVSNTIIVVISLSHSLDVALASLAFLVTIHKLEYFVNARIIGSRIQARAWELLIVMLVMEAAFGLQGVIAAPVYYAYLKKELSDQGLI
jgi:predicted PurR-regulated permease PerM